MGEHHFERDGIVQGQMMLTIRLEAVALSTSKAALDCILGGLYVQASMLLRHLTETWQKIAYTMLFPDTADAWLAKGGREPTPPGRNKIISRLRDSWLSDYAKQIEGINHQLDLFAHPSHAVLAAHDTLTEGKALIGGAFKKDTALPIIRIACVVQMTILNQHLLHMDPREEWKQQFLEGVRFLSEVFPEIHLEESNESPL
jgi:hypothetical protein